MTKFKNKYRIESNRMPGWDYSGNGFYYITIMVQHRKCLFGKIENDKTAVIIKIDDFIDMHKLPIEKYNHENKLWQSNYHDHIIRNEDEYWRIKKYIRNNPKNWTDDDLFE